MGKATEEAHEQLVMRSNSDEMTGVVLVKRPGEKNITAFKKFVFKEGDHVELGMMQWLEQQFPNGSFPDDSTIVFACTWSPCKQCTEALIPNWLATNAKLGERPLRVKFRYRKYYSAEEYTGDGSPKYVWMSNSIANTAYRELCDSYGIYKTVHDHSEAAEGLTRVTERHKPKLVFQRLKTGKTSFSGESTEGMLV